MFSLFPCQCLGMAHASQTSTLSELKREHSEQAHMSEGTAIPAAAAAAAVDPAAADVIETSDDCTASCQRGEPHTEQASASGEEWFTNVQTVQGHDTVLAAAASPCGGGNSGAPSR
eukprot:m.149630 g.149630  ORF g.149630 m.149630 type:complete len:116 (-) comp16862_c0_seq7:651-998(-)